jgi:hypothetical protein
MTLFGFSLCRATRLLIFALEALIIATLVGRLLGYLRPSAWNGFEGRVYGVLMFSLIYSFPLLVLLEVCSLPFSATRRFALWGLARSLSYVVALFAIVVVFGGAVS